LKGLAEWLAGTSGFPVHIASHGRRLLPGQAFLAPDGVHMGVEIGPSIVLSEHAPENGMRPSVAHLFRSVTQVLAPAAVGVLLTGMGRDGAAELKDMKDKGAVTIAQDKESSIVHGMPGEAIKLGGATYVMSPEGISEFLVGLTELSKVRQL
ncbi:MAG: CheB methylesterase domain-containing protein, partial [Desulfatirhabdiaceae bacterium]